MDLNGIFSLLEKISKDIESNEGKKQSVMDMFDKDLGISKEQHDKVVSLIEAFSDSEESINHYATQIDECEKTIKDLSNEIKDLEEELAKTRKKSERARKQSEIDEKKEDRNRVKERKQRLEDSKTKEQRKKERSEKQLNKRGVTNMATAKTKAAGMESELLGLTKGGGMAAKVSKFAKNPYVQAIDLFVKAIEFGIDKTTQYLRLNTENTLRLISATSTETINKMRVSMDAWEDAVNGAYSAQELAIDSQLSMIEAQNATAMANLKMANTWTNWIPIWKQINEYGEARLEQEQKIKEAWMKNAKEQLSMLNQYSKRIDTYNKEQDKAVHTYQAETGLSAGQTNVLEKRLLGMGETFAKFNKTIEDALKMQSQYAEASGRQVNFSNEDYKQNFAVGRLVGEDNLVNFEAQMNIFNHSVSDAAEIMYDMYRDANKMGISQKKLVKDVLGNLKLANKYDFKNGTKGFIELSKWAENARFNLGSLGGALEKIQSGGLENTITTSAKLQVLGGPFAMYSNPLAMEYQANADPEEYAKTIQKMFSTMGRFDEKTGETTFNYAENKMIRSAAESLGISVEDAKNMARGSRQKDVVKRQMGGSTLNKEDQDAIANMAKLDKDTGLWYVDKIGGGRIAVGDVKAQDMDKLRSGNKEEDAAKYAQSTLSVTEQIEATTKQINAQLGLLTFDKFKEMSKEEIKTTLDAYSKYQSNIEQLYTQQKSDNVKDLKKALEENLSKLLTNYNRNRTIIKSNGNRMSDDDEEDAGLKFDAGDRTNRTVNRVKGSPKARTELNTQKIEEAYNTDTRGWFDKFTDWLTGINRKNTRWVDSENDPKSVKTEQSKVKSSNSMRTQMWDAQMMAMPDGVASGNGNPMIVSAQNVTPIQDGAVKLAKSDPKDSALFAKTGGPFDKLFDDIFGKINAIYNMSFGSSSTTNNRYGGNMVQSMLENHFANVFGSSSTTNNRYGGNNYLKSDQLRHQYDSFGRVDARTGETGFNFAENMQMAHIAKLQGRNVDDVKNDIVYRNKNLVSPAPEKKQEYAMPSTESIRELARIATNGGSFESQQSPGVNQPMDVHIYGDLNLKSPTGETINLTQMIQNDPMLIKSVTELIINQIGKNIHGGRGELNRNRFAYT